MSSSGNSVLYNTWDKKILWRKTEGIDTLSFADIHSYPNALNSSGNLIITGQNNRDFPVLIYDLRNNSIDPLKGSSFSDRLGMIQSLVISPDEGHVIAGLKDFFVIWDLNDKMRNPKVIEMP